MRYFNSCILCDSTQLKPLKGFEKAYLSKCIQCGFVFSTCIPTFQELTAHYEGYGRNDYLSDLTIKRYHQLMDMFEPYRKTNKILDVGCGIGYFLDVAKERGWEVHGTEYTDKAIEICSSKGIHMQKGVLNAENYEPESFDIVTSFEVIEHINNPREELKNIVNLMRKGGAFYITTPNFNSLLRYHLKADYNIVTWPEHLSYYTPQTLTKLLKKVGLKKKFIETTGFSFTRLKTSKDPETPISGQVFIGENTADEKLRKSLESNKVLGGVKKIVNKSLTFAGKGDSLKGLFIKP